jgi:hypothetical protein
MKIDLRRVEKLVADNSPTLLTALGVTGTISTAVLAVRATFQAADLIYNERDRQDLMELGHPLDRKEEFQLVWKVYIPPVASGVVTIVCIIMANRIGHRRAAAVAAAFTVSQEAFEKYREKVVEKIGDKQERAVRDDVAQDQVRKDPPSREVIITGNGTVLCRDAFSGRYFESDVETIRKAINDLNQQILGFGYASLIGLDRTSVSDEVGWQKMITAEFSATMTEDNKPCMVLSYSVEPVRDYYRFS